MYEIQSLQLVYSVVNGNRELVGDIFEAAKNGDVAEVRAAAFAFESARLQGLDQLLAQKLGEAEIELKAQRQQLSNLIINDWDRLIDSLKAAGFSRWMAEAGDANPDLLDEIARLYAAATVGDRIKVITEYLAICAQYSPTPEQLEAWQAVLDNFQPHPIPSNLLWFVRPSPYLGAMSPPDRGMETAIETRKSAEETHANS
jgi:hypothetical protein